MSTSTMHLQETSSRSAIGKQTQTTIAVSHGDGIGPEIMSATLRILKEAGAPLHFEEVEIGERAYLGGVSSGIPEDAWESIRKHRILLKGPITTPQGGGYKSLNVTLRKSLGLFANTRACKSYAPFVRTKHPEMDVVIIRENEEDLYAGIEHRQTQEVVQCLKLITRPGCERIIRYAFEYAKSNHRKKVTCFSKDNIMKQTDGLFHAVFNEIAAEYPEIESNHMIIDIGAALIADRPEEFDVVVMPNLYGDIVSDITGQISGSVGLGGSANIGQDCAMFEAIHGSAPDLAGKDLANPSGLIQASILMLNHLGYFEVAERIQNAWLKTLESGIHTGDIYRPDLSTRNVGTREFADAVCQNLGAKPKRFSKADYSGFQPVQIPTYQRSKAETKTLEGVDIFVDWRGCDPADLALKLQALENASLQLSMITNRGVMVWPKGLEETFKTDHWRCRYSAVNGNQVRPQDVIEILQRAALTGVDVIKTENLYRFGEKRGYSLGQGQ